LVNRSALYAPARAQVVLARLLSKPVITAQVVGTSKLHHLDAARSLERGAGSMEWFAKQNKSVVDSARKPAKTCHRTCQNLS